VLDRDPDELNRIYAAQGLSLLMQTFAEDDAREVELQVVGNDHAGFVTGDIGEYRIAARKLVQSFEGSWPGRREDPLLTGGGREDFARAVDTLARLHTGELRQERLRLRLLLEAVRVEPFAPLRGASWPAVWSMPCRWRACGVFTRPCSMLPAACASPRWRS
jgi:hypothetical protein